MGNQLNGVRLVDEGLRARFKAAYPDVEVQPASPPRALAMDIDSSAAAQTRSPFSETKPASLPAEPTAVASGSSSAYASAAMSMDVDTV